MATKNAKRQAVQAIRRIVQAAKLLAEAEETLLREAPVAKRKASNHHQERKDT
jgi:hypothetical protein